MVITFVHTLAAARRARTLLTHNIIVYTRCTDRIIDNIYYMCNTCVLLTYACIPSYIIGMYYIRCAAKNASSRVLQRAAQ